MKIPAKYSYMTKALVAGGGSALFASVAALAASLADGNLTTPELLIAAGAGLAAFAAVGKATFEATNTGQTYVGEHRAETPEV